jgi:hypothetical protein
MAAVAGCVVAVDTAAGRSAGSAVDNVDCKAVAGLGVGRSAEAAANHAPAAAAVAAAANGCLVYKLFQSLDATKAGPQGSLGKQTHTWCATCNLQPVYWLLLTSRKTLLPITVMLIGPK